MSKYLHYFEVDGPKYERERKYNYKEPWASYVEENSEVKYNKTEEEKEEDKPENQYVTFEIQCGGTIYYAYSVNPVPIQCSINFGEWNTITPTQNGYPINVAAGDVLRFKHSGVTFNDEEDGVCNYFMTSEYNDVRFKVFGNLMSLVVGDDFKTVSGQVRYSYFYRLFHTCYGLTDATDLIFPDKLNRYCYYLMFQNCQNLVKGPATLPATELQEHCYDGMFNNCGSLTSAPPLPATTLADYCYNSMFYGCTNLTSAPELPATTLAYGCYSGMFNGCTSLTEAPSLPATTLTQSCYSYMFQNCTSLTSAPALPAEILANNCYRNMFYGCTGLTSAPELSATTLATYCYYYMFKGCTNLNYIKCLATDISAANSHTDWVSGVASSGTFVKAASMTGWSTGASGIPRNWTVQDAS